MKRTKVIEDFLKEVEIRIRGKWSREFPLTPSGMTYADVDRLYQSFRSGIIWGIMEDVLSEMKIRDERDTGERRLLTEEYYNDTQSKGDGN